MNCYVKPDADIELLEQDDILTTSYDTISDTSSTDSTIGDF